MTAPNPSESSRTLPSPCYAVGIDVSKATLDIVLLCPDGRSASTQIPNTDAGFEALGDWLDDPENLLTGDSSGGNPSEDLAAIHACLEASGGYEQPIARWLYRQGAVVSVINPSRTSAYADSQLRRSKTDAMDAQILARFCQREEPASWQPPAPDQEARKKAVRLCRDVDIDDAPHAGLTRSLDGLL